MYQLKKFFVGVLFVIVLVGAIGCTKEQKGETVHEQNAYNEKEDVPYTETAIEFEDERIYGSCTMRENSKGIVEYISLSQEQLTKDLKTQSYAYTYSENEWECEKTKWGELLKKELIKRINLKGRIYNSSLSIGADGKLYVTYNFYHPNAILESKGLDYEYFVSNFLFCIDLDTNDITYVDIPEASGGESEDEVNPLQCSAFSDGKLLIQDGKNAYIYDPVVGEKICDVEYVVNAGNYVAGDGVLYSAHVNNDGVFEVCGYNENDGKVYQKITLELYDSEIMSEVTQYKLKVYGYDLYLVSKEGIYRLTDGADEFEKVVDGIKNNLIKMTNKDYRIYDFTVLEDECFAVDYRKLMEESNDFDTYDKEYLVFYQKEGDEEKEQK